MSDFPECDHLPGHLRLICRGEHPPTRDRTDEFRAKWGLPPINTGTPQKPLTLLQRVKSVTKVAASTVAKGGKLLDETQIEARLSICRTCDQFTGTSCKLCGCSCSGNKTFKNKLAHAKSACPFSPPKWSAIDATVAPAASTTPLLPITADSMRHLVYHVYPRRDAEWRTICELLLSRIGVFNGRRLVGVSLDDTTDSEDEVRRYFAGSGCELTFVANDPVAGEWATVEPLMRELDRTTQPHDVVWRMHAKGTSLGTNKADKREAVRLWTEASHAVLLDTERVIAALATSRITGPFRKHHQYSPSLDPALWHFSGSMWALRCGDLFDKPWRDTSRTKSLRHWVETLPAILWSFEESSGLYGEQMHDCYKLAEITAVRAREPIPTDQPLPKTSVVIRAHNSAQWLADAINSVRRQPANLVASLLVVDDASTDGTGDMARAMGVACLRVEHRDMHLTLKAGVELATGELVVCLDADNILADGYLRSAVEMFRDPSVGIAYMDLQQFGRRSQLRRMPRTFDEAAFARQNFIDAGAVARRSALIDSGAFDGPSPCLTLTSEDYLRWRRVIRRGWQAVWHPVPLLYRVHDTNTNPLRTAKLRERGSAYYWDSGFQFETVEVQGDVGDWLASQTWPRITTEPSRCDWLLIVDRPPTDPDLIERLLKQSDHKTTELTANGARLIRRSQIPGFLCRDN